MATIDAAYLTERFDEALKNGFIRAFFQPIYRSMTGNMMCAESLARWIDPEYGVINPGLFITVLESEDKIFELDMEILRQACAFYRELKDRGIDLNSISVNLSRKDFSNHDLFNRVIEILDTYDVPHDVIKLEITESLMLEDVETFRDVMQKFNEAGFSMWMDDFGSGYSSLNVLKNYNFDLMKFDVLFLKDFSLKGRRLLASMINMAKSLGIQTLAEGVELKEHREFLKAAGCEVLQGFFFSRPMPKEELIKLIEDKTIELERSADRSYWGQIGQLNLLSASPLEDFVVSENGDHEIVGASVALLECTPDKVHYVYTSESYRRSLQELGYDSVSALEDAFNDHRANQYLLLKKFIDDTVRSGTIRYVEYVNNDVFYKLSAKCIARKDDSVMLATCLNTFDTEVELKTAKELMSYSNSLFSTYELVVLMYPESGIANRIYSSNILPEYDKEANIRMSLKKFCENEVDPEDQERYLKFLDFSTVSERVGNDPRGFIQGVFRMRWSGNERKWHIVRFSRVSTSSENSYILTIQAVPAAASLVLDMAIENHPELLG
jgi:EAL domain-containing protein (putative c-di-GMP-specific phosphodiesterase class I)